MASRPRLSFPNPNTTDPERPPPALPSHLLEEILLRVASPADLARAATACVAFRDLIADHTFLRRYRSSHPPLLLGFVGDFGFESPAEAPHPSAAVARAVSFSFDYLHRDTRWSDRWTACDARDGRVLFDCCKARNFWDLVVCDPLSRRYLLLPPITDDLLASIGIQRENVFNYGASFIPSGGIVEDTSFRVINWVKTRSSSLGVFIFSSDSGCWSSSTCISWGDLGLDERNGVISAEWTTNCFYLKVGSFMCISMLVKLDINTMRFCTIGLPFPHGHEDREIAIVESGESKVAMFSMIFEGTSVDYYTFSQNGSEKSHEWHLKSTIPLPAHYNGVRYVGRPAEGYIIIECNPDEEYSTFFSLEIKSLNIERVSRARIPLTAACPYFGFPPSMSPRRI